MREPERDLGRLQDILQAADNIISFTEGLTHEELASDKLRYFAVVKNVEIIGEAAYMLSLDFKEKYGYIPWKDIIRMRHVLVHGYATILPELLWHTALTEVPQLKSQIAQIIKLDYCSETGRTDRPQQRLQAHQFTSTDESDTPTARLG